MSASTLCIHCGLSAGEPPRLNRLEDGKVCPACAERLLAILPPLLPAAALRIERTGARSDELESAGAEYDDADFDRPA